MSDEHNPNRGPRIDPRTGFATDISQADEPSLLDAGSLHQVREILLGPISRELEQRLDQMQRNLEEKIAGRVEEVKGRIRQEAMMEISSAVNELREVAGSRQSTRDELSREIGSLRQEIEKLSAKSACELAEEAGRIRDEMLDRDTLVSLLTEGAARLKGPATEALTLEFDEREVDLDELLGPGSDDPA
jgi:hypothetical protein